MRPSDATTSTTSGSGLFHSEAASTPTSTQVPTVESTGAFVKTSGSGPMPTSRYWLHHPRSRRKDLRSAASAEPGRRVSSEPPMVAWISARIAPAASWSPRARSSITRSSIETGKVTPAAFTTCRSIGERSHGRSAWRCSGGVLASRSSSDPITGPVAAATAAAGSADSVRARMVGKVAETSTTPDSRIATTLGPPAAGTHARPTSVPA